MHVKNPPFKFLNLWTDFVFENKTDKSFKKYDVPKMKSTAITDCAHPY